MVDIKFAEPKVTGKKKIISVSNVTIQDNCLVDMETGEADVLDRIASEIPAGFECLKFKLTFELTDEGGENYL